MVGIDITSIDRFENKDENFAKKILSNNEFLDWEKEDAKELFLATRWAIKEAIFKSDNQFSNFSDINISKKQNRYVFQNFEISTSKENNFVIAIAIKKKDV
ncbi:MAG: 4'-phosphopantetheinyl transferase superfamily protein [Mycoplasmataceae bacterium]|nr:4'-phosphopantetheinyl transferase superfamily protein [Mycoplasmataceae bacterium]